MTLLSKACKRNASLVGIGASVRPGAGEDSAFQDAHAICRLEMVAEMAEQIVMEGCDENEDGKLMEAEVDTAKRFAE